MRVLRITLVLLVAALVLLFAVSSVAFRPPLASCDGARFDVILVLGFPAEPDGTPSRILRERMRAAVAAYQRGAADRILVTGGGAHNAIVEADAMAALAEELGVPPDRIVREREARNTLENFSRSVPILQAHGWRSVLIVSSDAHLPRAAYIASHHPIEYAVEGTGVSGLASLLSAVGGEIWERVNRLRLLAIGDARLPPRVLSDPPRARPPCFAPAA